VLNREELRRVLNAEKPLVGILDDVDGRIVSVAPPPIAKFLGKVTIAQDEEQSTKRHRG
jgi:hypothetical protein